MSSASLGFVGRCRWEVPKPQLRAWGREAACCGLSLVSPTAQAGTEAQGGREVPPPSWGPDVPAWDPPGAGSAASGLGLACGCWRACVVEVSLGGDTGQVKCKGPLSAQVTMVCFCALPQGWAWWGTLVLPPQDPSLWGIPGAPPYCRPSCPWVPVPVLPSLHLPRPGASSVFLSQGSRRGLPLMQPQKPPRVPADARVGCCGVPLQWRLEDRPSWGVCTPHMVIVPRRAFLCSQGLVFLLLSEG